MCKMDLDLVDGNSGSGGGSDDISASCELSDYQLFNQDVLRNGRRFPGGLINQKSSALD